MENISFVLWVCLFPVSIAVEKYFIVRRKEKSGEPNNPSGFVALIEFIIWVWIAIILYN